MLPTWVLLVRIEPLALVFLGFGLCSCEVQREGYGPCIYRAPLKDNSIFMLVYKCDGESYSTGKKCDNEVEDELPERWLSITGKIKNGLYDAHYLECNGTKHFCSRRCLENFLFKDVNPASGKAGVNNMFDPNQQQQGATNEQATEAAESAAQDQATGASESAEEGGAEG